MHWLHWRSKGKRTDRQANEMKILLTIVKDIFGNPEISSLSTVDRQLLDEVLIDDQPLMKEKFL